MCGINGFNWPDYELIAKMNDALAHRGPDGDGYHVNGSISLGHRRLSIIDLSDNGKQPMTFCHGNREVLIVYNGEIYNFRDIRKTLSAKGYRFKSATDTEVILAAYLEYGTDCITRFNGMWSFAIYDAARELFFCSRDRLGKKPFYYYYRDGKFIFSSELKGIREHTDLNLDKPGSINKEAVEYYFGLGFIPSPISIYNDVYKLEAGQNLVFDVSGKTLRKWQYYEHPRYEPVNDRAYLVKEGTRILRDATEIRLVADVPVGAFLSGGLDSSTVVGVMKDSLDLRNLHTFSVGFEGKWDESSYINIVKDHFGTKHHHHYFRKEDFEKLVNLHAVIFDEPFDDPSGFPMHYISDIARRDVTVALSGDGGDEIFGGYAKHQLAYRLSLLRKTPWLFRKLLFKLVNAIQKESDPVALGRVREALRLSLIEEHKFEYELYSQFKVIPQSVRLWFQEHFANLSKDRPFAEAVIKFDLFHFTLPDQYLVKVDRASMASSLEVRSPFLDYRFIEVSSRIPVKWKANLFNTKVLMREMVVDIVPRSIIKRGKQGFDPPLENWILEAGYANYSERALRDPAVRDIVSAEVVDFYTNIVFRDHDNSILRFYKIRLFIFLKWMEKWMGYRFS